MTKNNAARCLLTIKHRTLFYSRPFDFNAAGLIKIIGSGDLATIKSATSSFPLKMHRMATFTSG
ncbi:hypothetical protein C7W93_16700 [Glaciimonas sp. PCH181]|nr:hypothetical protein C7W93_16700 [Glaciimonas sp. PCH181]